MESVLAGLVRHHGKNFSGTSGESEEGFAASQRGQLTTEGIVKCRLAQEKVVT